ncbi:MAG: hypothetical protein RL653_4116 [Pseudomonadota bacterium]|jgi:hypothetical protein
MPPRAVAVLLCLVSLAASAQRAGTLEGKKIAVLEFTVAEGAKVQSRELLSDDCRGAVAAVARPEGALVITRENMLEVLKATGGKCVEGECEVETARNLGVDLFVTGSITSVDGELFLSLKAYETRKGELLGQRRISGAKEKALLELVRPTTVELVREAFGLGSARPTFAKVHTGVQLGTYGELGRDVVMDGGDEVLAKFESEPVGATVRMDGALLCKSTPCSKRVASGRHEVVFEQERYAAATVAAVIVKGAVIRGTLEPKFGWLTIETEPPGVSVTVDGVDAGKTPVSAREVDQGTVDVAVSDGCYVRTGERLAIKAGERRTVRLAAKPKLAGLKVNAVDEQGNDLEARVRVDGRDLGEAGASLKVPVCSKEVSVELNSGEWREALMLEEGKVLVLTARPDTHQGSETADEGTESNGAELAGAGGVAVAVPGTLVGGGRTGTRTQGAATSGSIVTKSSEAELHVRGAKQAMQYGLWKVAADSFRKALAVGADTPDVKAGLGICLVSADTGVRGYQEAVGLLRQALAQDGENARAWLSLGMASQFLGNNPEAVVAYKRYLALQPNGKSAAEVRAMLERL